MSVFRFSPLIVRARELAGRQGGAESGAGILFVPKVLSRSKFPDLRAQLESTRPLLQASGEVPPVAVGHVRRKTSNYISPAHTASETRIHFTLSVVDRTETTLAITWNSVPASEVTAIVRCPG